MTAGAILWISCFPYRALHTDTVVRAYTIAGSCRFGVRRDEVTPQLNAYLREVVCSWDRTGGQSHDYMALMASPAIEYDDRRSFYKSINIVVSIRPHYSGISFCPKLPARAFAGLF